MGQLTRKGSWVRWVAPALMVLGGLVVLKWALAIVLSPMVLLGGAVVGAWLLFRDDRKALPPAQAAPTATGNPDMDEFDRRLRAAEHAAESESTRGRRG